MAATPRRSRQRPRLLLGASALLLVALMGGAATTAPDWRPTLTTVLGAGADAAEVTLDERARPAPRLDPADDTGDAEQRTGHGRRRPGDHDRDDDGSDNRFEVTDDTLTTGRVPCVPDGCARWSLALGPRDAVVADDAHVVVATPSRILVIDALTASGRWQIAVPPGDGAVSTVHLVDRGVLIARPGRLELRRLGDGSARWSRPISVQDITDVQRLDAILLVTAGTVPNTDGAGVVALDVDTGAVRWALGVPDVRRPVIRVEAPNLAVQTSTERIVGIDPTTGRSRWARAGRVGFTDAAVLLAAPDGRVERLSTATGGSGAPISVNVADVLADGSWTVVRDQDATSRLIDARGRTVDERGQPALALAASRGTTGAPGPADTVDGAADPDDVGDVGDADGEDGEDGEDGADGADGAVVAYRDRDDIEVIRYDAGGTVVGRHLLPGGIGLWGSAPRLGLRGDTGLVISQDMRRSLRLPPMLDTADAEPRSWPVGTSTAALDDVLVAAGATGIELRGGGEPVHIDGRLRRATRVGDDVLVRTADGVVQIAGDVLRP